MGVTQVLVIGRDPWSFGATGPILRALGIGFALGAALMTLLSLLGG